MVIRRVCSEAGDSELLATGGNRCGVDIDGVIMVLSAYWAHDDLRILYDFTFYVPHSISDDVSSLFVMFFCENYSVFLTKSVNLRC